MDFCYESWTNLRMLIQRRRYDKVEEWNMENLIDFFQQGLTLVNLVEETNVRKPQNQQVMK